MNISKFLKGSAIALSILAFPLFAMPAKADSLSIDFESYALGNINAQDGWSKTGSFDVSVASNTYGFASFGTQSLRISDAVTSGSFGDQTFAKPLTDSAGETGSTNGAFSPGAKQSHFEAQFDIASTTPTEQSGMHVSFSPDRGDGSRMSYLRFDDTTAGIVVFFDDVINPGPLGTVSNFNETQIGVLDRATTHTVKMTMDFVDGAGNDVVKVYLDGVLSHTGTSWEDYYRFDPESVAEQSPRIVKTALFRESGTAHAPNLNNGFLVDNMILSSSTPDMVAPTAPVHVAPLDNSVVATPNFNFDWSDVVDPSSPVTYDWEASLSPTLNLDGSFTSVLASHVSLTNSEVFSSSTPDNVYYWHVRAVDALNNKSVWTSAWKVTVDTTPILIAPPTSKDQCKNNGWTTFNNPPFASKKACEKYVKDHARDGKAKGELKLGWPSQKIKFEVREDMDDDDDHDDHNRGLGKIEYWNYEYPGKLHYKTQALCVNVNKETKESRFMFQIPSGYPGLSGLYVVAYAKDVLPKHSTDLYGHAATADLATATAWCETGVGFSPSMYPILNGKVEIKK